MKTVNPRYEQVPYDEAVATIGGRRYAYQEFNLAQLKKLHLFATTVMSDNYIGQKSRDTKPVVALHVNHTMHLAYFSVLEGGDE